MTETSAPFSTNRAERMATVILSRCSGAWGTYEDMGFGRGKVIVDGIAAFASPGVDGWVVAIIGESVVCDRELETAFMMALQVAGLA